MTDILRQRTLGSSVSLKGVGLHTGRKCKATFRPAPENTGIVFVRTDIKGSPSFRAHVSNVVDVVRGTTLGEGEARVYTIEHILSAFNGFDIDNAYVDLDDNEPPVADGSAREFVRMINEAGIVEQSAPRTFFTVSEPFEYSASQTVIRIEPSDRFTIECEIEYAHHPMVGRQALVFTKGVDDYSREIAPARTYCFDYEIEALRKKGLAKGGSMENAIVIGPEGIYNPESALRFQNELVRHKILDLMGDLMLVGGPIRAKVTAKRCGHGHNVHFLRQLLSNREAASPSQ